MHYYHSIQACVKYQGYEFILPKTLTREQYELIRNLVLSLGVNINPPNFPVLHIKNVLFFIEFPSYGFPAFKINFYKNTPTDQVERYLGIINDCLKTQLQQE